MIRQKTQNKNIYNKYRFVQNLGILCISITLAIVINLTIDYDYLIRRIHVYFAPYIYIFYFTELAFFIVWLYVTRIREVRIGTHLIYGLISGCASGAIAYLFGISIDIIGMKPRTTLYPALGQTVLQLIFMNTTYPIFVLRSWLYGFLIALLFLSIRFFFRSFKN